MANKPIKQWINELPTTSSSTANMVVEEGGIPKKMPISSLPSGGSGGGASIIYATELPSTPQQAIYVVTQDEVVNVSMYSEGVKGCDAEMVYELPETGVPYLDMTTFTPYMYYCISESKVYGYFTEELAAMMELPWTGWVSAMFEDMPIIYSEGELADNPDCLLFTKKSRTRVYIANPDGTYLELTSGIRTLFDKVSDVATIIET